MDAKMIQGQIKQLLSSPELSAVRGFNTIGLIFGAVGTLTNLLTITTIIPLLLVRKNRAPNLKYSLIQALFDCLACCSWCLCEYKRVQLTKSDKSGKENNKTTQIICALYLSKSPFWGFCAYRSGINVLAAAHYFRRLVFARVRMPLDTSIGILLANVVFIFHAILAAVVHGVEVEVDELSGKCSVCRDLFVKYEKLVGCIKVAVVAHISLMYTFPVMSTMFFYTLMTAALRESRNPVHEKAYRDLKKIYYMDCTIFLVVFFPFICCFFLHHFSNEFDFGPTDPLYQVVFNIAFSYPALYPLVAAYLRRSLTEPLMSGLDFYTSKEEQQKMAVKRSTEEKVAENLDEQSMFSTKVQ
ncbi:unnamed protein product [Schistocephalus solidus]|uniref:G_PROTEIN_RECEP_F1_2 domain-containing protein n=1 Tax=Schistocephalus solidus TaxID=70667 RepID=A0A183TF06_SCHSO|nr:unnamed protein product [Schistocephalus solidus]